MDAQEWFAERSESALKQTGLDATVHAVDTSTRREVSRYPDRPVVAASVFKIPVLVEVCRQWAAGSLDPTRRVLVQAQDRPGGGIGISAMVDPVEISVRDLAYLMMALSDNDATDTLIGLVGRDAINRNLVRLGMAVTRLRSDCRTLLAQICDDLGGESEELNIEHPTPRLRALMQRAAAFDPDRTSATTAREMSTLLSRIWDGTAATPEACEQARRIMGLQVWPHRLTSGFPDSRIRVSGKTGTVSYVRNEVGVVEYPDGGRYCVSVFVRDPLENLRNPVADAVIGTLGRLAVDALRADRA